VINAASTARYRGLLEQINSGKAPGFAEGGLVGKPIKSQGELRKFEVAFDTDTQASMVEVADNFNKTAKELKKVLDTNPNARIFLDGIIKAEGTDQFNTDPYHTGFGGRKLPEVMDTHPGIKTPFQETTGKWNTSSAAGAYQFMEKTWGDVAKKLGFNGEGAFSNPTNQDLGALLLIKEKNALNDVLNGDFATAMDKLAGVWASFPKSPYPQAKRTEEQMKQFFGTPVKNKADMGVKELTETTKQQLAVSKDTAALDREMNKYWFNQFKFDPTATLQQQLDKLGMKSKVNPDELEYGDMRNINAILVQIEETSNTMRELAERGDDLSGGKERTADLVRLLTNAINKAIVVPQDPRLGTPVSGKASMAGTDAYKSFETTFINGLNNIFTGKASFKKVLMGIAENFANTVINTVTTSITQEFFKNSGLKGQIEKFFTGLYTKGEGTGKDAGLAFKNGSSLNPKLATDPDWIDKPAGGVDVASTMGEIKTGFSGLFGSFGETLSGFFSTLSGGFGKVIGMLFSGIQGMFSGGGGGGGSAIFGTLLKGIGMAFGSGGNGLPTDVALGGANAVGAVGGDSLGAFIDLKNNWSGMKFDTGGIVPGRVGEPQMAMVHSGETILPTHKKPGMGQSQVINLNITGDISRQTRSEIMGMLPSIANGVNSYNKEKGTR
jgi:muramidase (phage lysozyme)